MYNPSSFRMKDADAVRAFVTHNNFGLLVSQTAEGEWLATHIPWVWAPDADTPQLLGHVARANPHWRHLSGASVLVVFTGPHCYISPRWYEAGLEVPTWDYTAVHATGRARLLTDDELTQQVESLVAFHEPDAPLLQQLDHPDIVAQRQAIVGIAVEVEHLEGKQKLNQNRPAEQRARVVRVLADSVHESERAIAALIRATMPSSAEEASD